MEWLRFVRGSIKAYRLPTIHVMNVSALYIVSLTELLQRITYKRGSRKMFQRVKDMWISALLSGEFEQGERSLKDENGLYCCLGVLCELHRREVGISSWHIDYGGNIYRYLGSVGLLPKVVMDWAGLMEKDPTVSAGEGREMTLSGANDSACTFEQIGQFIEASL